MPLPALSLGRPEDGGGESRPAGSLLPLSHSVRRALAAHRCLPGSGVWEAAQTLRAPTHRPGSNLPGDNKGGCSEKDSEDL